MVLRAANAYSHTSQTKGQLPRAFIIDQDMGFAGLAVIVNFGLAPWENFPISKVGGKYILEFRGPCVFRFFGPVIPACIRRRPQKGELAKLSTPEDEKYPQLLIQGQPRTQLIALPAVIRAQIIAIDPRACRDEFVSGHLRPELESQIGEPHYPAFGVD